jgi:dihydropteroate synthase
LNFLNCKGKLLSLENPIIMGILNVTPDSFYAESRFLENNILPKAQQMYKDGATILDIGGYSTRPNAPEISEQEELRRVLPAIELIHTNLPDVIISIDTFRGEVAKQAIEKGASVINDISGGNLDTKMFENLAYFNENGINVPYILMHSKGNPQTMTQLTDYTHLEGDILQYFNEKIINLRKIGQKDIILDLGFGFAKTLDQNYQLLKNLQIFHIFELPLLVGVSRKSMIYRLLETTPQNSLLGSAVLHTIALQKGANIIRTHDIKETADTIKLVEKCSKV